MDELITAIGPLKCRILQQTSAAPELAVVLCHGFAAPGDDLVSIASALLHRAELADRSIQFVLPEGTLPVDPRGFFPGRAWWPLDMPRLAAMHHSGEAGIQAVCREVPAGLSQAREAMFTMLSALASKTGLPYSRMVLGGFSQGAMLATDVTLNLDETTAGLCLLSAGLISQAEWTSRAAQKRSLPVFQSHGRYDPVLSFVYGAALRELLVQAGLKVEFLPFEGVHTVPREILPPLASFLAKLTG